MPAEARPQRSSARLNTAGAGAATAGAPASAAGGEAAQRVAAAAAAAARRARAAERSREVEDSPRVLRDKCRRLAAALVNAKHLVVYTGAGISTAADIPDYRGPRGVWTRLRRGETVGRVEVSRAIPTFTHMALTALWARGTLKFVVSQNCDGLHMRAGLPRRALAELHGNMFAERCATCRRVYLRAFDTTERTARHAHGTRRLCHTCASELTDTIVHFGERGRAAWPLNWAGALRHAAAADVVLCLGSSLKVLRRYPRLWRMQRAPHARPDLYIVNLQWTPKDSVAKLKINARCDAVMGEVARRLRLRVPRYSPRRDPLLAHAEPLAPPEAHTTRRPALRVPSPHAQSPSPSESEVSSTSASDSDDEVPLRRLAERLRAPPPAAPPAPPPRPAPAPAPPPALLHAFQVRLSSGEARILLRAEHAPSAGGVAGGVAGGAAGAGRPLSELRRFRMPRRHTPPLPEHKPAPHLNGELRLDEKLEPKSIERIEPKREKLELESEVFDSRLDTLEPVARKMEPRIDRFEPKMEKLERLDSKVEPKIVKSEPRNGDARWDRKDEGKGGGGVNGADSLAAAIIARAVLLCRASLYPGLHTILGPEPPPPPAAGCAWCLRRYGARRCLWYGAPAATPLERRAWRRVRARRFLCACCAPADTADRAPAADADADGGGWFGKGYRKGRRRR